MRRIPVLNGYIDKQMRAAAERKHKKALMNIKTDIVRTKPPPVPRLVVYEKHQARDRTIQLQTENEKIKAITAIEQKNLYERMMRSSKRNGVSEDFALNQYMFTSRGGAPKRALRDIDRLINSKTSPRTLRKSQVNTAPYASRDFSLNNARFNKTSGNIDVKIENKEEQDKQYVPDMSENEDSKRIIDKDGLYIEDENHDTRAPECYNFGSPIKATLDIQTEDAVDQDTVDASNGI